MTDLNTAIQNRQDKFMEADKACARCTEYVELAKAAEQAVRRIYKLYHKCSVVKGVMEETMNWLKVLSFGPDRNGGVAGTEKDIKRLLKLEIEAYKGLPREMGRRDP